MDIKFIDLRAQYLSIKPEIDSAIQSVIDTCSFSSGPFVQAFEENYARFLGVRFCLGLNSGTSALHLAMWALGIGQGNEVIVPANTFFATPEAVSLCGATPVFADCEPEYFNIDPDGIAGVISSRTKAIVAVHLYGQPAQLDRLRRIADENDLLLIEDAAQAHFAEYKGKHVGTFGSCGCFSFYPGKNLGAYGEAGAVVTNDEELYLKMLAMRDHGAHKKYHHDYVGHNYRMEGFQGAVLDVKLKYLDDWTDKRRSHAVLYRKYLEDIEEVRLPLEMSEAKHVYHLFVIRTLRRNNLKKFLQENGIQTGIHYPIPCHLQKAYGGAKGSLPVAEQYADEILSLPMYAELQAEQIKFVCDKIREYYRQCE